VGDSAGEAIVIDLGTNLETAIREARRIRRNLVRLRGDTDLGGDCGLASILLADALGDTASLRGVADQCADPCMSHIWNVIDGVIIDITATQFNDYIESDRAGEPPVFGVLVTKKPRLYHRPVQFRGRRVLDYLLEEAWYEDRSRRRIRAAMERLRARRSRP
jgi:hypothetical protein